MLQKRACILAPVWGMPDGKFCGNTQLEPDIKVRNTPALSTTGRDEQIEAAVKELMK